MSDYTTIKTFEDACRATGKIPANVLHHTDTPDEDAYKRLKVIVAALNDGWIPDWDNLTDNKRHISMSMTNEMQGYPAGITVFGRSNIVTNVPPPLILRSNDIALYCAEQFIDLWRTYFGISQS